MSLLLGEDGSKIFTKEGCRVTEYGLLYKRHYIPWRDLASIESQGTKVVITPRSGSASSKMSFSGHEIANTYVLVELVTAILKQRNERAGVGNNEQMDNFHIGT